MNDLEQKLQSLLPLRIILKKCEDGRYEGMVEHSFHLAFDKHRVNIFWSNTAYDQFGGKHNLKAIKDAEYNAAILGGEVYDPLSPECPVAVDLYSWIETIKDKNAKKFDKRNAFMEQR